MNFLEGGQQIKCGNDGITAGIVCTRKVYPDNALCCK